MNMKAYPEWDDWLEHRRQQQKDERRERIQRDDLDYAVTYVPMTDEEIQMVNDLSRCTFQVASYNKRFVRSMVARAENEKTVTKKQGDNIRRLHHRFRKQISRLR